MKVAVAVLLLSVFCLALAKNDLSALKDQYQNAQSSVNRKTSTSFIREALEKVDPFSAKYRDIKLNWFHRSGATSQKRVCVVLNAENVNRLLPVASELADNGNTVTLLVSDATEIPASNSLPVERTSNAEKLTLSASPALQRSFVVYQHLDRATPYDVVITTGPDAYYSLLARTERISFLTTAFLFGVLDANFPQLTSFDSEHLGDVYELRFMEFKQFDMADRVFSFEETIHRPYVPLEKTFAITAAAADWNNFVGTIPHFDLTVIQGTPKVSICIVHFNRPALLLQAIDSVVSQSYKNIEVILVDNGSTERDVPSFLNEMENKMPKGWKIVRSVKQTVSVAKNLAVQHATGEYVLFLDDDNFLKPEAVETYVSAAINSEADVLTSPHEVFRGNEAPVVPVRTWLPLGPSAIVGLVRNCFGDANFFARRQLLNSIPFSNEAVAYEEYEFYTHALLAGKKISVVPQVLLWNRQHSANQLPFGASPILNKLRALRPYAELLGLSGVAKFLASLDSQEAVETTECNDTESPCGSGCCDMATHHCNLSEKQCKVNPFPCPADGRHLYCNDLGRCVPIGGTDGHGRSDCGVCGFHCAESEVCAKAESGWTCMAANDLKTEPVLYNTPAVHKHEDGSVFVETPEFSVGYIAQGEEKAFPAPDFSGFRDIILLEDEVMEVESSVCLNSLRSGDKFRLHAMPTRKAFKATALNNGGSEITKENPCIHFTSATPIRSLVLQRIGAPRRVEGRSIPTMKFHQTARAVRSTSASAAVVSTEEAQVTQVDTPNTRVPVITIVNFNFAGTLPRGLCATN